MLCIKHEGIKLTKSKDVAKAFNNYFASVGLKLAANIQGAMFPVIRSNMDSFVLNLTSAGEIGKIII